MYLCNRCNALFLWPAFIKERHGFCQPPYETLACCPTCKSGEIRLQERRKCYAKR